MTILDRPMSATRVKAIRHALGMRQLEFAFYLKVGEGTISAWENGKNKPSRLAESAIKALCVAHGVDWREVRG